MTASEKSWHVRNDAADAGAGEILIYGELAEMALREDDKPPVPFLMTCRRSATSRR
ncbi:MAG: hypothetical protein LBR38_02810 [Synergistaceae bacterium]|jgi:hypothetical protein|nr:hypothetical protein [Synergistaceae bacterium]